MYVCGRVYVCVSVGWTPAAAASVEQFQYFIKDIQRVLPALPCPVPCPAPAPLQAGVKCNSATLALQLFSLNVEQAGSRLEGRDECQVMHMLLFTLPVLQKKQTTRAAAKISKPNSPSRYPSPNPFSIPLLPPLPLSPTACLAVITHTHCGTAVNATTTAIESLSPSLSTAVMLLPKGDGVGEDCSRNPTQK